MVATDGEIEFLQRYSWEQVEHLGHVDHSPASVWVRHNGLTNLDVGRFVIALDAINIRLPFITEAPRSEFQSP